MLVIEFMYPDFMWVAADQVFNQIGKARHMFGGDSAMPLVLRTKVAMGTGYGSQHSAGSGRHLCHRTRLADRGAFHALRLCRADEFGAICAGPVLVLEHVDLYASKGPAPADDLDYSIPLGKAKVVRSGTKATILTYLAMVEKTLKSVEVLGVDVEVIDLRSLDRAGLDWETVEASGSQDRQCSGGRARCGRHLLWRMAGG